MYCQRNMRILILRCTVTCNYCIIPCIRLGFRFRIYTSMILLVVVLSLINSSSNSLNCGNSVLSNYIHRLAHSTGKTFRSTTTSLFSFGDPDNSAPNVRKRYFQVRAVHNCLPYHLLLISNIMHRILHESTIGSHLMIQI